MMMNEIKYRQLKGKENSYCLGVSLPFDMLKKLDDMRRNVPRSTFIARILERQLAEVEKEEEMMKKGNEQ